MMEIGAETEDKEEKEDIDTDIETPEVTSRWPDLPYVVLECIYKKVF